MKKNKVSRLKYLYYTLSLLYIAMFIVMFSPNDANAATNIKNFSVTIRKEECFYVYGTEVKPTVTVKDSEKNITLINNTDYTVCYTNNKKVGTGNLVVVGKGNYEGKINRKFIIKRPDLSKATVVIDGSNFIYNGTYIKPKFSVKFNNKTLQPFKDYVFSYSNNLKAGRAKIKIWNNDSSKTTYFTISQQNLSNCSLYFNGLSSSNNEYYAYYNGGKEIKPSVVVKLNGKIIGKENYIVNYTSNRSVGQAKVILEAKGNFYGSLTKSFTIKPFNITKANVYFRNSMVYGSSPVIKITTKDFELKRLDDYVLAHGTLNVWKRKIVIRGKNNCTGEIEKTIKVTPINLSKATIKVKDAISNNPLTVNGYGSHTLDIKLGSTSLVKNQDYKVISVTNEKHKNKQTIRLKGIRNYSGTVTVRLNVKE